MTHGERLVQEAAAAFNAADADRFAALAHPEDFLFAPILTRAPDGAPYRGLDGARRYVSDAHAWAETRITPKDVADHGDVIVAHCDLDLAVGDRRQRLPVVYIARIKDGLVAEMTTLADVSAAATVLGVEPPPPAGPVLQMEVPARPPSVAAVRSAVREFASSRGVQDVHAVALAVTEAATNAVLHAYPEGEEPGPITVSGTDLPGAILITIADEGRGLLPRPDSPGLGVGLALMQQLSSEISFVGPPQRAAGTEVRLRFPRG